MASAIVLQTSYLTPPFGYAIFFLKGAVADLKLITVYRGVIPFVVLQLLGVAAIWEWPQLVLWLPGVLAN